MSRKRNILIDILEIILALILGYLISSYVYEEHQGNKPYQYPHENYLGNNISNDDIDFYTSFSKGVTINETDIYNLSCHIIEDGLLNDYDNCGTKENISSETYSVLSSGLVNENYIPDTFSYSVRVIKYYDNKAVVQFIDEYKYDLNGEICNSNSLSFPTYLYLKWDNNKWQVEYVDFYIS